MSTPNPHTAARIALATSAIALAAAAVLWRTPTPVAAQSAPGPDPASVAFYTEKVQPIFAANCYRCHGGMNHRGGLQMDTQTGLFRGGHDGVVLLPGYPQASLLIKLIRHEGPANDPMPMPPRGKISDADIATVTAWVQAGAAMPPDPK